MPNGSGAVSPELANSAPVEIIKMKNLSGRLFYFVMPLLNQGESITIYNYRTPERHDNKKNET